MELVISTNARTVKADIDIMLAETLIRANKYKTYRHRGFPFRVITSKIIAFMDDGRLSRYAKYQPAEVSQLTAGDLRRLNKYLDRLETERKADR